MAVPAYNVTPGSLTSCSVQARRKIHTSTRTGEQERGGHKAERLAPGRRFLTTPTLGRQMRHRPPGADAHLSFI